MASRVSKQIDRMPVKQNTEVVPLQNGLTPDDDLQSINCICLSDYNVIICQNTHNGQPCGYGVLLASLLSHCWGEISAGLQTCEQSPH